MKPSKWWMKLLNFASKCQDVSIVEQFLDYNVRYFDLRIRFDKEYPRVCHGMIEYFCTVLYTLDELAKEAKEKVYVRVLLEQNGPRKDQRAQEWLFKKYCEDLTKLYSYPNLVFVGGRRKYDWKLLYDFGNEEPTVDEQHCSTTAPFSWIKPGTWAAKIDDFWPWLYAKLNNKKIFKRGTDKDVLFVDFVNIR